MSGAGNTGAGPSNQNNADTEGASRLRKNPLPCIELMHKVYGPHCAVNDNMVSASQIDEIVKVTMTKKNKSLQKKVITMKKTIFMVYQNQDHINRWEISHQCRLRYLHITDDLGNMVTEVVELIVGDETNLAARQHKPREEELLWTHT
ncbi:unnamed protein product [Microthlaspi erraticum]|uniref:Uncharacterized protein n=1 Tax=Microthlaspi erraticum TaxID=1685480 RepID=A0A6D2J1S2_9BRAS|nr:unnamed protein product [Microthlaspi erraticum]